MVRGRERLRLRVVGKGRGGKSEETILCVYQVCKEKKARRLGEDFRLRGASEGATVFILLFSLIFL